MKKLLLIILPLFALAACGAPKTLYYWGGSSNGTTMYEELTYRDYKQQDPASVCKLLCLYEDMVKHPGGSRKMPPPGICAEYGYLLLSPDTPTIFSEHATASQKAAFSSTDYGTIFTERGKEMLQKEMEYYPESAQFLMPIIKKLSR